MVRQCWSGLANYVNIDLTALTRVAEYLAERLMYDVYKRRVAAVRVGVMIVEELFRHWSQNSSLFTPTLLPVLRQMLLSEEPAIQLLGCRVVRAAGEGEGVWKMGASIGPRDIPRRPADGGVLDGTVCRVL